MRPPICAMDPSSYQVFSLVHNYLNKERPICLDLLDIQELTSQVVIRLQTVAAKERLLTDVFIITHHATGLLLQHIGILLKSLQWMPKRVRAVLDAMNFGQDYEAVHGVLVEYVGELQDLATVVDDIERSIPLSSPEHKIRNLVADYDEKCTKIRDISKRVLEYCMRIDDVIDNLPLDMTPYDLLHALEESV